MIRVVFEHTKQLFAMGMADEATLTPTIWHNGTTYYRVETHRHYILYRAAISGFGAGQPGDSRPVFDAGQR